MKRTKESFITFYVLRFTLYVLRFILPAWFLLGFFPMRSASTLYAHAELIRAEPFPGAFLAEPPKEIRLTFNEPLAAGSRITLLVGDFRTVAGVETRLDPEAAAQLVADVPDLEPGVYTVQWLAISADGHEVSGSYGFGVGGPTGPEPGITSLRWWQLLLLFGTGMLLLVTFLRQYRRHRRRRPVQPAEETQG